MSDKPQVLVIRRRAVGTISSIIGAGGVIGGVIALLWAGAFAPYVIGAFALGAVGLLVWAIATPDEFVHFFTGRGMRLGTISIFSTLLLIGIATLVYLQFTRTAWTFDTTQRSAFTLSPETERVLARVDRPMRIIGFYSARALRERAVDDQIFQLYQTATNNLVTREYINPDEQPALARRYGVTMDGQVFVAFVNPDGTIDLGTLFPVTRGVGQEREITRAIASLIVAGRIVVYFETGLGGRDPNDTTQEGISGIVGGVRQNGIIPQAIDLPALARRGGNIPADAAALIFTRPTRDLTAEEVQLVRSYLTRGGSLLIMTDVLFNEQPFMAQNGLFNRFLLEEYGIGALDAAVVDPALSGQTPLDIISANVFATSPIAARLDPATTPTLFTVARAVDVRLQGLPPNIATGRVIFTTDRAYGETDLRTLGETNRTQYDAGVDLPSPLATVVWSTNTRTNARIVLIGDGDFVANGRLLTREGEVSFPGNAILFTDSVVWLTNFNEVINFEPQMFSQNLPLIFVSQQQFSTIAFFTVIFMPLMVLLIGVAIRIRRGQA